MLRIRFDTQMSNFCNIGRMWAMVELRKGRVNFVDLWLNRVTERISNIMIA
jgi:hypothetical protein